MTESSDIAARQNEEHSLELQAAKNWLYDRARSVARAQVWTTVVGPLALATMKVADPELSPWVALYTVLALVLEPEMDNQQEQLRTDAARVQEVFDRQLFRLSWPREAIGPEPSAEDLRRWARPYRYRRGEWKNWYPLNVDKLPFAVARIACQRTNGWWDSDLRERYVSLLRIAEYGVVGIALLVGFLRGLSVVELVTLGALLAPVFRWLRRTLRRHQRSAVGRQRLFDWARRLCDGWKRGELSEQDLDTPAAQIQRETFEQRRTSLTLPTRLYLRSRDENEEAVHAAVRALGE